MHGVKVYLKSQREGLYHGLVLLAAGSLFTMAFFHFQEYPRDWPWTLAYLLPALVMVTQVSLVSKKTRRQSRYLPALLLLLSAGHLALRLAAPLSYPPATSEAFLLLHLIFFTALATAGPLVVGTRFAYFSIRRIRIRYHAFKAIEFPWQDVKFVELEDEFLEIERRKGKDIRLVPAYKHTQHLRSYLNEISLKARQQAKTEAPQAPTDSKEPHLRQG